MKYIIYLGCFFLLLTSCKQKKYDSKILFDNELELYEVKVGNKIGLVDKEDNIIIPIEYNKISSFSNDKILVENSKRGLYDKKGNIIIPSDFSSIKTLIGDGNLYVVYEQEPTFGCFLYNDEGKRISKKYSQIDIFSNNLALVKYIRNAEKPGYIYIKAGYINKNGREVIPCVFDYAYSFSENGLAAVNYQGKWGFINENGKEIIPYQFDEAKSFPMFSFFDYYPPLLAAVKYNGKWGFVNEKGKLVIPFRYDYVGDFFEYGTIEVQIKAERFFINKKGQRIDNGTRSSNNYISGYSIR